MTKIYVPSCTTNLSATDVTFTDTRADKNYCGLVGDDLRTTNLEERATSLENRTTNLERRASNSETEINNIKKGTTIVGKATRLENARTINGTPFDGSSNITTQKWGQERNITIDGVTKSIDGSSNIDFNTINIKSVSIVIPLPFSIEGCSKVGEKCLIFIRKIIIGSSVKLKQQSIPQIVLLGRVGTDNVTKLIVPSGSDETTIIPLVTENESGSFIFIIGVPN